MDTNPLKKLDIKDLQLNPFTMFAEDWGLLTAGNQAVGYNTMTISWGHIGSIWNGLGTPTIITYVRPQRYTKQFMDANDKFTVSIIGQEHKQDLTYLGKTSGADVDKVANTSLTPVFDEEVTYFKEAKYVFVCRKLYVDELKENGFLDKGIVESAYPLKDFHHMYVGEIVEVFGKRCSVLL